MKIRGFGDISDGPAFAEDVLRIKVSGPTGLHLTVVDLPGLIAVHSDEQTEDDEQMVHRMVDTYAQNSRTIILAVVQAGNDIANQGIIKKSRKFDKAGQRTIGIITKPDLINEGTEKKIALLAQNRDSTKLKLGYFILKNPRPTEMANGITPEQRRINELQFFRSSPWKEQGLSEDRVGIDSLRVFLQNLLDGHVERELPKVREEIKKLMTKKEREMLEMGEERHTVGQLRMFVTRVSTQFQALVRAGLHGDYQEGDVAFFTNDESEINPMRLRALVHHLNTEFSDYLREDGQKRKIVPATENADNDGEGEDNCSTPQISAEDNQILVTKDEMKAWVKTVYINSRGRELPGNYSHILLSQLFHDQSSRWYQIAKDHVETVHEQLVLFVTEVLGHVTNDDRLFDEVIGIVESAMTKNRQAAVRELENLWNDELQQPITYNHYFTDNVQRSRQDTARLLVKKAVEEATEVEYRSKMRISSTFFDIDKLQGALQRRVNVNMDEQACAEAMNGLEAYYKVAQKTFIDNVCKQVIERHLLRTLPLIFCPDSVAGYADDQLERIAAETTENVEKRKALQTLLASLESSLDDLRR